MTGSIPILILGDGPDQPTGLGRIGHDLAWVLSSLPEFQVGYLGRESLGRVKYPWQQYTFSRHEQWGEHKLMEAWGDLSRGRKGVVFTVWDASRLLWFAKPNTGLPEPLRRFLISGLFERWGYFMVDGEGVRSGQLPAEQAIVIEEYDRAAIASRWGLGLTRNSLPTKSGIAYLPHPINRNNFNIHIPAWHARSLWGLGEQEQDEGKGVLVLGCVMANQERKHWPTVFEAVAYLNNIGIRTHLWAHSDRLMHYWHLQALAIEYGITDRVLMDLDQEGQFRRLTDKELALRYRGCDATISISGGEGFCYPVAESLSCGVPVITGEYGAQAELVERVAGTLRPVPIAATHICTSHNVRRAVYNGQVIGVDIARWWKRHKENVDLEEFEKQVAGSAERLDSVKVGREWAEWFRAGVRGDEKANAKL